MSTKKSNQQVMVAWPTPDFTNLKKTNPKFRNLYYGAMNYAQYEMSPTDLKKEVIKYLKKKNPKHELLDQVRLVPEARFAAVGKYTYVLNNGGELIDDLEEKVENAIRDVVLNNTEIMQAKEDRTPVDNQQTVKVQTTIQEKLKDRVSPFIAEVEGWFDDVVVNGCDQKSIQDFVGYFKSNELKGNHMRLVADAFALRKNEIEELMAPGTDRDLVEGYKNLDKTALKKFEQFIKNLTSACNMVSDSAKVERVPKVKKPMPKDKLVTKLKFKKNDVTLGIVSINPVDIIGAKTVWAYNTKTRKLICIVADDLQGPIGVKNSTITGLCTLKSTYKTLKKPLEQLAQFKACGKGQLRKFYDGIQTVDVKFNGRMNEDIVILRADK